MNAIGQERPLSPREEKLVWDTICMKMQPDDRDPDEVIAKDFGGDRQYYLRVMAKYHGINIY